MINNFAKYLKNIPDLAPIILELNNFRQSNNKNYKQLVMTIKKDKELHNNILRIINFNIFDFEGKPKNILNFISLTSLEFVVALATALAISQTIKGDLFSYAITNDELLYSNTLAILIVEKWLMSIDINLKNELLIPAFLQNISIPIISLAIRENRLTEQFLNKIASSDTTKAEEFFVGYSSERVSSNILKNWGFSHNIIFPILFSKDLTNAPISFRKKALFVNIINQITNPRDILNDKNIKKAVDELDLFNLDSSIFFNIITKIKGIIKSNS